MNSKDMVHIRLKPEGVRELIGDIIWDYQNDGEATSLTSAINKVVREWVDKGAIPIKYRTK